MQQRLQKIIAQAGLASRRSAEELISAGRVRVNGLVVTELGAKADPGKDRVEVDGKKLVRDDYVYVAYHKPRNVVSTLADPEGRPTVAEHLAQLKVRAFPVGRLDFATSGILLITNDGEFSNAMLHPKRHVPKTYIVKVRGRMEAKDMDRWRKGIMLEDGVTLPADLKFVRYEEDKTWFEITLTEGRNQQIRRMGDATRFLVMRLSRLSFAGISSEGLKPGELRTLTREELRVLKDAYGVPKRLSAGGVDPLAPTHRGKPVRSVEEIPRGRVRPGEARRSTSARRPSEGRAGSPREADTFAARAPRHEGHRPERREATTDRRPRRDGPPNERAPRRESPATTDRRPRRDGPPNERAPRRESPATTDRRPRRDGPPNERAPRRESPATTDRRPRRDGPPNERAPRRESPATTDRRPRRDGPPNERQARGRTTRAPGTDVKSERTDRFGKKPRGAG